MIADFSKLLSDEQVKRIHEASLEILENVGLEVNNQKARNIFARHGCFVDDETMRVKFPAVVVNEFIQMTPSTFTFHARNPDFNKTIPKDAPVCVTASSAPFIIDPVTRKSRSSTSEDICRIASLVNRLKGVDIFSVSVLADDAPKGQYSLTRFYSALKHCEKPIRGSGDPGVDCDAILDLAYTIAGSEAAYKANPFITHHYCPIISPLKMDDASTELLMFYTEHGLPSHPTIVPNGGLTSPMTLTGTLAQGNAEFLVCAILMQMVRPRTPTVYSNLSTMGDMRSGAYAPGGIECGMLNMAHAQMARFYNVPSSGYVGLTNSKLVDAQAGFEKSLSAMGAMLSGQHMLQFVGLIEALMAFDYSMAMIDNEISLMLKRMWKGMEFSEEDLALNEIEEVGPSGMFICTEKTLERMETGAFLPDIANRETRQAWMENGSLDASEKAYQRALEVLKEDSKTFFSEEVEFKLRSKYTSLVKGQLSIPENWSK